MLLPVSGSGHSVRCMNTRASNGDKTIRGDFLMVFIIGEHTTEANYLTARF